MSDVTKIRSTYMTGHPSEWERWKYVIFLMLTVENMSDELGCLLTLPFRFCAQSPVLLIIVPSF